MSKNRTSSFVLNDAHDKADATTDKDEESNASHILGNKGDVSPVVSVPTGPPSFQSNASVQDEKFFPSTFSGLETNADASSRTNEILSSIISEIMNEDAGKATCETTTETATHEGTLDQMDLAFNHADLTATADEHQAEDLPVSASSLSLLPLELHGESNSLEQSPPPIDDALWHQHRQTPLSNRPLRQQEQQEQQEQQQLQQLQQQKFPSQTVRISPSIPRPLLTPRSSSSSASSLSSIFSISHSHSWQNVIENDDAVAVSFPFSAVEELPLSKEYCMQQLQLQPERDIFQDNNQYPNLATINPSDTHSLYSMASSKQSKQSSKCTVYQDDDPNKDDDSEIDDLNASYLSPSLKQSDHSHHNAPPGDTTNSNLPLHRHRRQTSSSSASSSSSVKNLIPFWDDFNRRSTSSFSSASSFSSKSSSSNFICPVSSSSSPSPSWRPSKINPTTWERSFTNEISSQDEPVMSMTPKQTYNSSLTHSVRSPPKLHIDNAQDNNIKTHFVSDTESDRDDDNLSSSSSSSSSLSNTSSSLNEEEETDHISTSSSDDYDENVDGDDASIGAFPTSLMTSPTKCPEQENEYAKEEKQPVEDNLASKEAIGSFDKDIALQTATVSLHQEINICNDSKGNQLNSNVGAASTAIITTSNRRNEISHTGNRRKEGGPRFTQRQRKEQLELDRLVQSAKIVSLTPENKSAPPAANIANVQNSKNENNGSVNNKPSTSSHEQSLTQTNENEENESTRITKVRQATFARTPSKLSFNYKNSLLLNRSRKGALDPTTSTCTPNYDAENQEATHDDVPNRSKEGGTNCHETVGTSSVSYDNEHGCCHHGHQRTMQRNEGEQKKNWFAISLLIVSLCMLGVIIGAVTGVTTRQKGGIDEHHMTPPVNGDSTKWEGFVPTAPPSRKTSSHFPSLELAASHSTHSHQSRSTSSPSPKPTLLRSGAPSAKISTSTEPTSSIVYPPTEEKTVNPANNSPETSSGPFSPSLLGTGTTFPTDNSSSESTSVIPSKYHSLRPTEVSTIEYPSSQPAIPHVEHSSLRQSVAPSIRPSNLQTILTINDSPSLPPTMLPHIAHPPVQPSTAQTSDILSAYPTILSISKLPSLQTVVTAVSEKPSEKPDIISPTMSPESYPGFSNSHYVQAGQAITGTSPGNEVGRSISLSADGTLFVVAQSGATRLILNDTTTTYQFGAGMVQVYSRQMDDIKSTPIDPESIRWVPMGDPLWGSGATVAFGFTTCLSRDGTVLAISEPGFDLPGGVLNAGAVRVFRYEKEMKSWVTLGGQNQALVGEASGNLFGYSIALSGNGTQMAVGSPKLDSSEGGYNSGAVRLLQFDDESQGWIILGDPLHGLSSNDLFGTTCSMSYNGSIVAVGAPESEEGGYVQIFRRNVEDIQKWEEIGIIYNEAPNSSPRDSFGKSVSLSSDGNQIAIGAPGYLDQSGVVAVFELSLSLMSWGIQGEVIHASMTQRSLGNFVSLSSDGSVLVIGVPGEVENGNDGGQVLVLQWNENRWVESSSPLQVGREKDRFGFAVATSGDGSWVGVGAPALNQLGDSRGYAYVYLSNECVKDGSCL